jgi:hypothetical protein
MRATDRSIAAVQRGPTASPCLFHTSPAVAKPGRARMVPLREAVSAKCEVPKLCPICEVSAGQARNLCAEAVGQFE